MGRTGFPKSIAHAANAELGDFNIQQPFTTALIAAITAVIS